MKCTLRHWREQDAADLALALNNQKILDNLRDGLPFPYTERDAAQFIAAMHSADPDKVFAYAIDVGGHAVGSISATRQGNIHFRTAEVGYYVAEPFWGQGIATNAVTQICDLLFSQTDILRIFAQPFAHNLASCRVLEKASFSCEGLLRKSAVKHGVILDMKLYARLRY